MAQDLPWRAVCLLGAVDALLSKNGEQLDSADRSVFDRSLALTHSKVDAVTWQTAWRAGQAMSVEQAVAYGLREETEEHQAHTTLAIPD